MRVTYGTHPDQVADVVLPESGAAPAPMVILLHGGFWRSVYDRHHLAGVAQALADAGYCVVNAEYRRVGDGGGWPGTFHDVALAVDSLPGLVAATFPGRADAEAVVLLGHSAGGHLALWAAVRGQLADQAPGTAPTTSWVAALPGVTGVVALAPVCDLGSAHRLNSGNGAVAALLGGTPDEVPERFAQADPAALGRPPVPTVVVHGEDDVLLPVEVARTWCSATGTPLVEVPGAGHFELIDPGSAAWPQVLDALAAVLSR
ncbi:alpha/beta hydrolase [Actinotalea sp.]|uniref:alpha/beta hydrolase n=1 Tax=Actinotalea sp. TaxID=1872145 RepID=UPI0035648850